MWKMFPSDIIHAVPEFIWERRVMSINWKEVCKFLSGAFFVSAGVNAYFYVTHVAVPFLGFTISPELLGLRSIIHFVLFLICFYIGFIRN
jgi:hypothetical protein